MDIRQAIYELSKLEDASKYEAMIKTAAIITKLLEKDDIKPIIVGGLSVEIYTQNDYATRDIDFVSPAYEKVADVLEELGFKKDNRHYYHDKIEIAIEIPSSDLAGSYDKVAKVMIDNDSYVYLISIEDIILDRLRAGVHWKSEEDILWGFRMLTTNIDVVDLPYLLKNCETKIEREELGNWLETLEVNIEAYI